jgi:hypothetical protein
MTTWTGDDVWTDTVVGPDAGTARLVDVINMGQLEANRSRWLHNRINGSAQTINTKFAGTGYSETPPSTAQDLDTSWKPIGDVAIGVDAADTDLVIVSARIHLHHVRTAGGWTALKLVMTTPGAVYDSPIVWTGAPSGAFSYGLAPINISYLFPVGTGDDGALAIALHGRVVTAAAMGDTARVYAPWAMHAEVRRIVDSGV